MFLVLDLLNVRFLISILHFLNQSGAAVVLSSLLALPLWALWNIFVIVQLTVAWAGPSFLFEDVQRIGAQDHAFVHFSFWLSSSCPFAVVTFFWEDFQASDMTEESWELDRELSIFMYLLLHEIHCFVCMTIYILTYFIGPGWSFVVSDQFLGRPVQTGCSKVQDQSRPVLVGSVWSLMWRKKFRTSCSLSPFQIRKKTGPDRTLKHYGRVAASFTVTALRGWRLWTIWMELFFLAMQNQRDW